MQTSLLVAQSISLAVGGLAGATVICWLLWQVCKLLHHPDWAALAIVFLAGLGVTGNLPHNDLLNLTLTFLAIAMIPLWIEGRTWRKGYRAPGGQSDVSSSVALESVRARGPFDQTPYPAISACLSSGRRPSRDEIRLVATRIWREAFVARGDQMLQTPSFSSRRILVRTAIAALAGSQAPVTYGQSAV
jgi:hypothetical protein